DINHKCALLFFSAVCKDIGYLYFSTTNQGECHFAIPYETILICMPPCRFPIRRKIVPVNSRRGVCVTHFSGRHTVLSVIVYPRFLFAYAPSYKRPHLMVNKTIVEIIYRISFRLSKHYSTSCLQTNILYIDPIPSLFP